MSIRGKAKLYSDRVKASAERIGKVIGAALLSEGATASAKYTAEVTAAAITESSVLPNAWMTNDTSLQSSRYILRSSERYLLTDSDGNVLSYVP